MKKTVNSVTLEFTARELLFGLADFIRDVGQDALVDSSCVPSVEEAQKMVGSVLARNMDEVRAGFRAGILCGILDIDSHVPPGSSVVVIVRWPDERGEGGLSACELRLSGDEVCW